MRDPPAAGRCRDSVPRFAGTLLTKLLGTGRSQGRSGSTEQGPQEFCCLSLPAQLCPLHTHQQPCLHFGLFLLIKGKRTHAQKKGKVDSGQKSLVPHLSRSSAHANTPRIAGAAPLLLCSFTAPKTGECLHPEHGGDTPARAGAGPGPGWCDQGDSAAAAASASSGICKQGPVPAVRRAAKS